MSRAQSLLAEIGGEAMAGPEIRRATSRIRDALDRAALAADRLAEVAEQSAGDFDRTLTDAAAVVRDVQDASAEMREAFGLGTGNEEPAARPTTSPPSQLPGAPQLPGGDSRPTSAKTEVTALGPQSRVK
jgi:hypothetical protein